MSLFHFWWGTDTALCGSTEVHPCLVDGAWPTVTWDDVVCPVCDAPICRRCMTVSATRQGRPFEKVALLRLPRIVVSV